MRALRVVGLVLLVILLLLLGLCATQVFSPYLSPWRKEALVVFLLLGLVALVVGSSLWRGGRRVGGLLALYGLALGGTPGVLQFRFSEQRAQVMELPASTLARWSPHLIVGYRSFDEMRAILEQMELGGIYVTRPNVQGREVAEVRLEITRLQAIQRRRGHGPLLVTADQEGQPVTRLSPPLPPLQGLARVARTPDWRGAVTAHARRAARGLRRLGVNMNLAPVVDLAVPLSRWLDTHSSIEECAISDDATRVAEVAELYSATLWHEGVLATAKHFPGLGHVAEDTHHLPGVLARTRQELQISDWVPFERLAHAAFPVAMMVAHVKAPEIDARHLASVSEQLVSGVLRGELGQRGLIVTDDMCMSPMFYSRGGIAARTRDALAAGVDLVLITFDPDQLYPALLGLSRLPASEIPLQRMRASRQRILRVRKQLAAFPEPEREP